MIEVELRKQSNYLMEKRPLPVSTPRYRTDRSWNNAETSWPFNLIGQTFKAIQPDESIRIYQLVQAAQDISGPSFLQWATKHKYLVKPVSQKPAYQRDQAGQTDLTVPKGNFFWSLIHG